MYELVLLGCHSVKRDVAGRQRGEIGGRVRAKRRPWGRPSLHPNACGRHAGSLPSV